MGRLRLTRAGYFKTAGHHLARMAVAGVLLAGAVVGGRWLLAHFQATADSWQTIAESARNVPLRIEPSADDVFAISPSKMRWIRQQLKPPADGRMTSSLCLHQMHVHGVDARLEMDGQSVPILEILLNEELAQRYLGGRSASATRYGVRFTGVSPTGRDHASTGAESHRDQCLGCFAELGIPLSREMLVDGRRFTVRDSLRDSLAEFHLGQEELAWTAIAYALYLPPTQSWTNRFSETFCFDDVVEELLGRPLDKASCCGMHIINALTVIARVDAQSSILSEQIRSLVWSYLRKLSKAAVSRRRPDGSWTFDWHRGIVAYAPIAHVHSGRPTPETTLLATGHVAEWMLILPKDMQPQDEVRRNAAGWLYDRLRESTEEDQLKNFCPYTHAVYVLRHCAGVSTAGASGLSGPAESVDCQDTTRVGSFPVSHFVIRRD